MADFTKQIEQRAQTVRSFSASLTVSHSAKDD